jgi:D-alanyl-D-alanine dipeptidase/esterase/lipase
MSKKLIYISFPFLLLAGIYFLGPAPKAPKYDPTMPTVPQATAELEKYVADQEGKHKLKPDNEARIIWADSSKEKTEYSVVYLHGFSASQEEGAPVHRNFAKKFKCNLYLARMADHGVDTTEQLLNFTPDRWWQSSKEALAIGKALGNKVIIMSTSTGGTLALMLAAEYPQDVYALINMSPNIAIFHPLAGLSNNPWGLQLSRQVVGGNYNVSKSIPGVDMKLQNQYWNDNYRLEAVGQLQELLETKMTKATFNKIKQPSLSMYYFKSDAEQDSTVKVSAILEMNKQLSTPDSLKETVAIPEAGTHVIGSYIRSKDVFSVERAAEQFATHKLKMKIDYGIKPMTLEAYKKSLKNNPDNELVDLGKVVPNIVLDIKYATTDNFTKAKIYNLAKAYARKPVAQALVKAQAEFNKLGYSVKMFDSYRPYSATVKFYEIMKGDTMYVASPYKGSKHNRGCALDMSIVDLKTGQELKMPTEYDASVKEAWHTAPVADPEIRKNREILISVMERNGFKVYEAEWWHFDFVGWQKFEVMNIDFEELGKQ